MIYRKETHIPIGYSSDFKRKCRTIKNVLRNYVSLSHQTGYVNIQKCHPVKLSDQSKLELVVSGER